jgi:hypothetical protein
MNKERPGKKLDRTMIRLIPKRRFHVSNRLAILAALILAVTSFTGIPGKGPNDQNSAANEVTTVSLQADKQANTGNSTTRKRKLNISVLLFGHG